MGRLLRIAWPIALVGAFACTDDAAEQSARVVQRCVADAIGELRSTATLPDCPVGDSACRAACEAGDGPSCVASAQSIEQNAATLGEAVSLYHRSCALGMAIGCTNYAAHIWARDHSEDELSCALRTFEAACAAGEPFACGMIGRVLLDGATTPSQVSEAQGKLEMACDRIGGFPCRVLAKHLEAGDFGAHDPSRIATLLERACQTGDPDACGRPASASQTFH